MPQSDRVPVSVIAVVALLVLATGCVALPSNEGETTAAATTLETAEPPSTVTATFELTIEHDGERESVTEPVWLRADGTSRIGDADAGSEFVRVDDGTRVWRYDVSDDVVTVRYSNETETGFLEFLYAEQARFADEYEITDVEETTIDGEDAHRISFDPPTNETIERSIDIAVGDTEYVLPLVTTTAERPGYADRIELWTERDRAFPLKVVIVADGFELTMTYTDVRFGDDLDDDLFTFEPPESATVENESSPNDPTEWVDSGD